jgi:hypothetical protein
MAGRTMPVSAVLFRYLQSSLHAVEKWRDIQRDRRPLILQQCGAFLFEYWMKFSFLPG